MTSRKISVARALLAATAGSLALSLSALSLSAAVVPAHATGPAGPAVHDHGDHASKGGHHRSSTPIVIAHRGASGHRPEHTLEAYRLAIRQGADYVEPDLVSTKDGVLVARHENEISGTTDVAARPEFAARKATKVIDGVVVTGWFTEDFTLRELKRLRAKERLPQVRPGNTVYDGLFQIPTLDEVIALVRSESRRAHRTIGIAPETKHPTYFDSIGLSLEEPLVRTLRRNGLDRRNAKVVIQSFETTNLRQLDRVTRVPLAQLVDAAGAPYDLKAAGKATTYADLVTPAGLADMARYADWVAPAKNLILPRDGDGATGAPSALVDDAHDVGLSVVTWTLRAENQFLATNFRIGTDPNAPGDMVAETRAFLDAGVDALFTDQPDLGVSARDAWVAAQD